MSRLHDLIARHCPDGVPHKALGQIGEFRRGRRFTKEDVVDEGLPSIHYGEIYTHYGTWALSALAHVRSDLRGQLRFARPGDVVVAGVGETVEEVGKAVAWLGAGEVAFHDDCFALRHEQDPKYIAYAMQASEFHAQKNKYVARAKVKRLSGESLARIKIPVPPLAVQREIVRVLDLYTELKAGLEAELEAELEARRKQYAHYRHALLTFNDVDDVDGGVRWIPLGELAAIGTGSRNTNEAVEGGRYPFFVRSQEPLGIEEYEFEETAVITAGDGVGVGKVFHFVEGRYGLHQRAYRIVVTANTLLSKFLFHFIRNDFARYLATISVHASVTSLRKPMFEKYLVPVPPIEEQRRIVGILDKFDALVADLSAGLPAEIRARRQQYEYYRDRLFTFEEAA